MSQLALLHGDAPPASWSNPDAVYLGWTKGGHGRNSQRVLGIGLDSWPEAAPAYSPQARLFAEAV